MKTVLTLRVGPAWLAIDVGAVEEIAEVGAITALPRTPPHVAGLMNLRGLAVPVVDLARFLELPPAADPPEFDRIVIVRSPDGRIALRCDQVRGVEDADAEHAELRFSRGRLAEFARGEIEGDGVVTVLAVDRLLAAARVGA